MVVEQDKGQFRLINERDRGSSNNSFTVNLFHLLLSHRELESFRSNIIIKTIN